MDRLRELEVVVEAVLDRRADRDLHARIEAPDGLGEQVRRRVPQDVERVRIVLVAGGEDLDLLARRRAAAAGPCTCPFERTSTACSASLGPIARAASRPVAPSGSSSFEPSGSRTFTAAEDSRDAEERRAARRDGCQRAFPVTSRRASYRARRHRPGQWYVPSWSRPLLRSRTPARGRGFVIPALARSQHSGNRGSTASGRAIPRTSGPCSPRPPPASRSAGRCSTAGRRRRDARLFLVSLACLASAGFLGLHALATPGVLLGKNAGFELATPVGLVLASALRRASRSLEFGPTVRVGMLLRLAPASLAGARVVLGPVGRRLARGAAAARPPLAPEQLDGWQLALAGVGVALLRGRRGRLPPPLPAAASAVRDRRRPSRSRCSPRR